MRTSSTIGECGVVVRGILPARRAPRREVRQLREQHGRLQRVEPAVVTDFVVVVGLHAAVHAEPAQALVAIASSCVTIIPPSPYPPRFFDGKKLKVPMVAASPAMHPLAVDLSCARRSTGPRPR